MFHTAPPNGSNTKLENNHDQRRTDEFAIMQNMNTNHELDGREDCGTPINKPS